MEEEVFKVVWQSEYSVDRNYGWSTIANHNLTVRYAIGLTTMPTIGKLFAFRTRNDAQVYADSFNPRDISIFRCVASGVEDAPPNIPSSHESMLCIQDFWRDRVLCWTYDVATPIGTVFCDTITPLERVA